MFDCRFFLFIADTKVMRQVFNNVDDAFRLQLTLGAPVLLGKDKNMTFMNGPPHKALRKMLLPLFTRQALGVYLEIQEKTIRQHIGQWLAECESSKEFLEMRPRIRDMNVQTSYQVGNTGCNTMLLESADSRCFSLLGLISAA